MPNSHPGHSRTLCRCGQVVAQCRCPGPKPDRVSAEPCEHRGIPIDDIVLGAGVIAGDTVRLPGEEHP